MVVIIGRGVDLETDLFNISTTLCDLRCNNHHHELLTNCLWDIFTQTPFLTPSPNDDHIAVIFTNKIDRQISIFKVVIHNTIVTKDKAIDIARQVIYDATDNNRVLGMISIQIEKIIASSSACYQIIILNYAVFIFYPLVTYETNHDDFDITQVQL